MRPRTLLRGAIGGASLLGIGLGLFACEEETDYAYFKVKVTLSADADADFLARIASCGVNVLDTSGTILDFSPIGCSEGRVGSRELGVVDWSTVEKSGQVRFQVVVKDRATREIAKGTSADFAIVPKGTVEGQMEVKRLPDPVVVQAGQDAGAGDGGS